MFGFHHKAVGYHLPTEEECLEVLADVDDEYEEETIVEQAVIEARKIDLAGEIVEFPWHGYSESDFVSLNNALQEKLAKLGEINNLKSVLRFKKRNQDLYNAYFLSPIEVLYQQNADSYSFSGDGRHRIWVAQKTNSCLPVWIVKYEKIKTLPIDIFVKTCTYGEWRFY